MNTNNFRYFDELKVENWFEAGDRVEFVQVEPGHFELVAATQSVTQLKGMVRKPVNPVTIEAMNEAISAQGGSAK